MLKLPFKWSLPRLPFRIVNWKTPWKIQRITGPELTISALPKEGIAAGEGVAPLMEEVGLAQPIPTPKNKPRSPMTGIITAALVAGVGLGIWAGVSYYAHLKAAEETALLEAAEKAKGPTREEIIAEYQEKIKEKVGPLLEKGNKELAEYDLPAEGSLSEQTIAIESIRIKHLDGLLKTLRRMKVPDGCYDFHSDMMKSVEGLKGGAEYMAAGLKENNPDKLLHGYSLREDAYKNLYPVYYNVLAIKTQPESKVAQGH